MSLICVSEGFRSYVDGYVMDEYGELYCLSLFGGISSVTAVIAGVLSGRQVVLQDGVATRHLWKPYRVKYRIFNKRLPSGLLNQVLLTERALLSGDRDFVIITRDDAKPVDLLFRNLMRRSEIPLHEVWKEWVWMVFEKNEWITKLIGYRMDGYNVSFSDQWLADAVSNAIKRGGIPRIDGKVGVAS